MDMENASTSSAKLNVASLENGTKRKQGDPDCGTTPDNAAVRRRITRACDQCNQLRTKCDGKKPCVHCVQNNLGCEYARTYRKRGRAPRKVSENDETLKAFERNVVNQPAASPAQGQQLQPDFSRTSNTAVAQASQYRGEAVRVSDENLALPSLSGNVLLQTPSMAGSRNAFFAENDLSYGFQESTTYGIGTNGGNGFGFPLGDDYSVAFMGKAPLVETPEWLMMAPTSASGDYLSTEPLLPEGLTYPVLLPLIPHLNSVVPVKLACDLLEQYFTPVNTHLRPKNPYIIGSVFRKKSILHASNPRPCSPALLASMLWISAQHSDAIFLTSQPDARSRTCQKLLELTINMLKPLVHNHHAADMTDNLPQSSPAHIDTSLAGLVSLHDPLSNTTANRTQLDHIITYMHLGTVVSASERKAASLRWWNAAWSLAREIRLGRELQVDTANQQTSTRTHDAHHADDREKHNPPPIKERARPLNSIVPSEEHREERRRVWWLLYMTDRHLALCYNRPMFFLNQECESLLLPVTDEIWQSDQFDTLAQLDRQRGLDIQCTSHSIFGYFLPLMVILGEILDLNYARNRPRLGRRAVPPRSWNANIEEILQYLTELEESLHAFEATGADRLIDQYNSATSPASGPSISDHRYESSEARLQTDTVVAYSRHIMHVLHILLTGKWDPIALLDDNDLWISSQSFVTATGHAVSAANSLADIIEYDPDLSLIPYFFGIYLLQGSFLLLLFADKLQGDISPDVVKACETIVRAHEACVATLDTQYQRNFRKVMRSALQQLRGRIREDAVEQQNWRRGILKLYRWTGDGTGLAL